MKILAIDPGYERVGIAVIEKIESEKKEKLIYSDCFKTSAKIPFKERLFLIGNEIKKIINNFNPDYFAIEKLFFTTNQKTAMAVSEARGVIIYEATIKKIPIFEYTPLQIKIAITGYGKATKNQIIEMTKKLILTPEKARKDDEFDAIAIGLTCSASYKKDSLLKKTKITK